jgi:hypothetical protein
MVGRQDCVIGDGHHRPRLLAGQIACLASTITLDAIRRGGAAYDTVLE